MPATAKRHWLFVVRLAFVCLILLLSAAAFAEQTPQQNGDQNDLQLYRLESMERRLESAERSGERLLVAAVVLAMLLLAVVLTGAWRAYLRWHSERLNATARNARQLMRDIKAELDRPQLAHLRSGYELRRIMRRLRRGATLAASDARMLAECGMNGDMPASLYLTARALLAETSGEWHLAAKWLDGLVMSGMKDDADVLLHLAHVHDNIAAADEDAQSRRRHLALSKQYYAQFAFVLPADYRDMPPPPKAAPQQPKPQPPQKAEVAEPPPPKAEVAESPPPKVEVAESLPPQKEQVAESLPKPQQPPKENVAESPPVKEQIAESPPPKPQPPQKTEVAVSSPPPKEKVADVSPPKERAAELLPPVKGQVAESSLPKPQIPPKEKVAGKVAESLPPPKVPPAVASLPPKVRVAEASSSKPQLSPKVQVAESPKPKDKVAELPKEKVGELPPGEKVAVSSPPGEKVAVSSSPSPKRQYESAPPVLFADARQIAEADREQSQEPVKRAVANARNATQDGYAAMLSYWRGGSLPLIPLVPILPPPADAKGAQLMMWSEIAHGNRRMYRAALALSVHGRNRHLDAAIKHYNRAQMHQTGDYLYHNFGLAYVARALHTPEKDRQQYFKMAADKFVAGNAMRPHYFDFSLAALYALANDGEQCRQWLQESGAADKDALRAAEFDNVRGHRWFAEFAG